MFLSNSLNIPPQLADLVDVQDQLFERGIDNIGAFLRLSILDLSSIICYAFRIRPNSAELYIKTILEIYLNIQDQERFRIALGRLSIKTIPAISRHLYNKGFLIWSEISDFIKYQSNEEAMMCYFDIKPLCCNEKTLSIYESEYNYNKDNHIALNECIEYGFPIGTIEFNLKYDLIDEMGSFLVSTNVSDSKAKWNPFEWSFPPRSYDFLSVCAHFGSINCFRILLLNGCRINGDLFCSSVFGGSCEIINLVSTYNCSKNGSLLQASRTSRYQIFEWLWNSNLLSDHSEIVSYCIRSFLFLLCNGYDINTYDDINQQFFIYHFIF